MPPLIKTAVTLRQEDIDLIEAIAKEKSVGRSAVIRWAMDAYRLFLSSDSTCRIIDHVETTPDQPESPTP